MRSLVSALRIHNRPRTPQPARPCVAVQWMAASKRAKRISATQRAQDARAPRSIHVAFVSHTMSDLAFVSRTVSDLAMMHISRRLLSRRLTLVSSLTVSLSLRTRALGRSPHSKRTSTRLGLDGGLAISSRYSPPAWREDLARLRSIVQPNRQHCRVHGKHRARTWDNALETEITSRWRWG